MINYGLFYILKTVVIADCGLCFGDGDSWDSRYFITTDYRSITMRLGYVVPMNGLFNEIFIGLVLALV